MINWFEIGRIQLRCSLFVSVWKTMVLRVCFFLWWYNYASKLWKLSEKLWLLMIFKLKISYILIRNWKKIRFEYFWIWYFRLKMYWPKSKSYSKVQLQFLLKFLHLAKSWLEVLAWPLEFYRLTKSNFILLINFKYKYYYIIFFLTDSLGGVLIFGGVICNLDKGSLENWLFSISSRWSCSASQSPTSSSS